MHAEKMQSPLGSGDAEAAGSETEREREVEIEPVIQKSGSSAFVHVQHKGGLSKWSPCFYKYRRCT